MGGGGGGSRAAPSVAQRSREPALLVQGAQAEDALRQERDRYKMLYVAECARARDLQVALESMRRTEAKRLAKVGAHTPRIVQRGQLRPHAPGALRLAW